jgi:protein phosphatase
MGIRIVSSAMSDKGKVRSSNQDSGYSGVNLYVVADGMGGHAGGDIASALATQHVAKIDDVFADSDQGMNSLLESMREANRNISATVKKYGYLSGMGTTMDAVLFTGDIANIAHIGDSRVYLMRDSELFQITKDHTYVQQLVDDGQITLEEAFYHPRSNLITRVLGDTSQEPEFDIHQVEVRVGDRFLLCSDGLCGVVPLGLIEENMRLADIDEAVELLIDEAKEFGAPDNVTVLILEVREASDSPELPQATIWLGSAANEVVIKSNTSGRILEMFSPVRWVEAIRDAGKKGSVQTSSDPALAKAIGEFGVKVRSWKIRGLALVLILAIASGASIWGVYAYTQTRYYLGVENGNVVIYQGIKESFGGIGFSKLYRDSEIVVSELPAFQQELLTQTISADSLQDAEEKIQKIIESSKNG